MEYESTDYSQTIKVTREGKLMLFVRVKKCDNTGVFFVGQTSLPIMGVCEIFTGEYEFLLSVDEL